MEPLIKISEADEAEIKVMITNLYKSDGVYAVLASVQTMQKVMIIIMKKLNELLEEEKTQ
jgi:hypothetical protein